MRQNAISGGPCVLTIAGVRFTLSGAVGSASFNPFVSPFLQDGCDSDLSCDVCAVGPDAALEALPCVPDSLWAFALCEGRCEVIRRHHSGRVLWQVVGSADLARVRVAWHPTLFEAQYGSYRQAWSKGLGLSLLGLRLRMSGGLLLHGAAATLDGNGILCVGVSGVGKSTLSRLLTAAGETVFTDERPVVRQWQSPNRAFRVYGTPWPSSAKAVCNDWAPLRRIYFITHGAADQITPLSPQEAVRRLIPVTTVPWQAPDLLDPCLATLDALVRTVPCARFAFRPAAAAVVALRDDLRQPTKGIPA